MHFFNELAVSAFQYFDASVHCSTWMCPDFPPELLLRTLRGSGHFLPDSQLQFLTNATHLDQEVCSQSVRQLPVFPVPPGSGGNLRGDARGNGQEAVQERGQGSPF